MSLASDSTIKKLQSEVMVELYFAPAKDKDVKTAIADMCNNLFHIDDNEDCIWVDSEFCKATFGSITFSTIIFPIRILKNKKYANHLRNLYESSPKLSFGVSELQKAVPDVQLYYSGYFYETKDGK